MKDAPKVRRDGKCYVCRKERTFNYQRGVPRWAYERDPFCSSACARKFFGTELKNPTAAGEGDTSRHRGIGISFGRKVVGKGSKYA